MPDFDTAEVQLKRGPGRPRKEPEPGQPPKKKGFLGFGGGEKKEGVTLSKAEADRLHDPFLAALKDDAKYLDQGLWWYTKDATQPQIWSDLDNDEIKIIGEALLRRAQHSPATALLVRNVIEMHENISMLIILGPRLLKTGQQLGKKPKRERKQRQPA